MLISLLLLDLEEVIKIPNKGIYIDYDKVSVKNCSKPIKLKILYISNVVILIIDFYACVKNNKYADANDGLLTIDLLSFGAHPEQANPKTETDHILDTSEIIVIYIDVPFSNSTEANVSQIGQDAFHLDAFRIHKVLMRISQFELERIFDIEGLCIVNFTSQK